MAHYEYTVITRGDLLIVGTSGARLVGIMSTI